jgi:ATP-dependent exoDNAse (exonuclease V) alpha subunit
VASHISVRLFWHDSGWDGAICRDPAANVWCEAHDHIRDHKSDREADEDVRGKPPGESGVHPGCEVSLQTFSRRRNEIRVWPPEWMAASGVQPIDLEIDKSSTGMWPYEEMWGENGGYKPNSERRAIAEAFFEEVEPGKSLAFFYVDERNPLFLDDGGRSAHRVLAGVSRITGYEKDIREWNETTWNGETNMVWSVPFSHGYPRDGVRLPIQAIEAAVADPVQRERYLVPLDGGLRTDFRYGSSRVTMDRAVAVVERSIAALARIEQDGVLETSVAGELAWLNGVLLEIWDERGPYPGLAPLLLALDCPRAAEVARHARHGTAEGGDPAALVFEALEAGEAGPFGDFAEAVEDAAEEWGYLGADDRELARLLVRMELTKDQLDVVLRPESRLRHGLPASAGELLANPYVLCERFLPKREGEPISFLTVDHGLLPHEAMAALGEQRVPRRDPRRLRALLVEALRARAADGDSFAHAGEALEFAARHSPPDRPCDVPPERLAHEKVAPVLAEAIEVFEVEGETYLALLSLRDDEIAIAETLDGLAHRKRKERGGTDWQQVADCLAARSEGDLVELSVQQRAALDRSLASSLSVIAGSAGTGKSTLLGPLIEAIRQLDGEQPVRALTPTGKAADRLKDVGVEAMTIHRALATAGWYDHELETWTEGEGRIEAHTLIIDESSMVDVELLGMVVRATDWDQVRRLVLVGDHHQLPPIGPGRPFFDLIARMQDADESGDDAYRDRLSELTNNYRVESGSAAIAFANSFSQRAEAGDSLVWEAVAKGNDRDDLRIRYWSDQEDLYEKLLAEIARLVEAECAAHDLDPEDSRSFDATIGHGDSPPGPSHWQILAPMRGGPHGTRKLNALVQDRHHGWAKRAKRWESGAYARWPVKMGAEQITRFDKVMQISNERFPFWRPGEKMDDEEKKERCAIFNGQIGTVRSESPRADQRSRKKHEKGNVKSLAVEFEGLPGVRIDYYKEGRRGIDRNLELAYAVSVHKGQGSQFQHVMFVVPQDAANYFGRELTYTGLTRARQSLTLFVERDIGPLLALRKHAAAQTPQRNSRLFTPQVGAMSYRAGKLVYGTTRGDRVASKSEVIIADLLHRYESEGALSYLYERELFAPGGDGSDFRLPDFTIHVGGRTFFWEHCGMMDDPAYRERWEQVRLPWYKRHGFAKQLIVTEDGESNPIDSGLIERDCIKAILLA